MGKLQVCVPQTCCFLFFSMCVCDPGGPLKAYSSVLLMCFMSHGSALAWPMDSLPLIVWCGLITGERQRLYGKTPFIPQSIRFDLTRWCNADQQTGENVKVTVCVCVCVAVCMWGVWECVCAYVLVCVINASIIHCFKHVLRTSLKFLWRQVMILMLFLWRVYMYICVVNKYFLFK